MSHDTHISHDAKRQAYLEGQGFCVERFANGDVVKNPGVIALTICGRAQELIDQQQKRPIPTPLSGGVTLPQGKGALTSSAFLKTSSVVS